MIIMGIDPGAKTGGVSYCDYDIIVNRYSYIDVRPMPPSSDLGDLFDSLKPDLVYIEKAQSFPKQGISSAFNYGDHFGQLQGLCIAFKVPYVLVPPRNWTKGILLGTKTKDSPKKRNIEAARRLFPQVSLVAEGCRVPHMGIVDALLIMHFGRLQFSTLSGYF